MNPATLAASLPPVEERSTGAVTLGRLVLSASQRGEDVALYDPRRTPDHSVSYAQLGRGARDVARGLIALGVQPHDTVSILGSTSAEWTICDLGSMCAGAVVAPIYHTNSPEECRYVVTHSQARLVFCEDPGQAAKIAAVREDCPKLEHVVVMSGIAPGATTMADFLAAGGDVEPSEVEARIDAVTPDDLATIVYTSGTTGPPKGCMLTHHNFIAANSMARSMLQMDEVQPVIYQFLPLAHVFARIIQTVTLDVGGTLIYWSGDPKLIVDDLAKAEPTHFPAVPRIYEKVHTAVMAKVAEGDPISRTVFHWALSEGYRAQRARRSGKSLGRLAAARYGLADRVALSKVRELFGPRLIMGIVGAAPISADLLEFFDACGVMVLEGWGMTETCSVGMLNPPEEPHFGTIGHAMPGAEVRIADDGEILARGPHIFQGYFRNQEATDEAMEGGWLHTGDLGSISSDGYVTITGRKKDLIVTSSGKNITPVNIENALRETRWISEAVVYGDRHSYLVAMITLDRDEAPKLAEQVGIPHDRAAMAADERVRAVIQQEVDRVNERFARIEQIKRFGILDHDLTQPDGELTPTLKVKRGFVYKKYADFFERLYDEE